jgi:hypothetical protein
VVGVTEAVSVQLGRVKTAVSGIDFVGINEAFSGCR